VDIDQHHYGASLNAFVFRFHWCPCPRTVTLSMLQETFETACGESATE
jgi:hypothetical protein